MVTDLREQAKTRQQIAIAYEDAYYHPEELFVSLEAAEKEIGELRGRLEDVFLANANAGGELLITFEELLKIVFEGELNKKMKQEKLTEDVFKEDMKIEHLVLAGGILFKLKNSEGDVK